MMSRLRSMMYKAVLRILILMEGGDDGYSNPSNDFTLGLVGTHNIFFNNLTVDRSNGTAMIQGY